MKEKLNEATQKHETFANQVIRLEGERDLQNSTLTLAQERYANLEDRCKLQVKFFFDILFQLFQLHSY